jgi:hypothetical protein
MATSVPNRQADGRSEGRIPKRLAAEVLCPGGSVPREMAFTENVSPRGARVITAQLWQPGTRVLLTFPETSIRFQGRIVYCRRLESGNFAVGLELSR